MVKSLLPVFHAMHIFEYKLRLLPHPHVITSSFGSRTIVHHRIYAGRNASGHCFRQYLVINREHSVASGQGGAVQCGAVCADSSMRETTW